MVGLVYSKATGRLRSIVLPDSDAELVNRPLNSGENLLTISQGQYTAAADLQTLQNIISTQTGVSPTDDRYVMVGAEGLVDSVHFVDAACGDGAYPGFSLVKHSTADRGWVSLLGGRFIALSKFPNKATTYAWRQRKRPNR